MEALTEIVRAHPAAVGRLAFFVGVVVGGALTTFAQDAELRRDVLAALQKAGWTLQAAAAQIGISRQRLGHQLDGSDPLTAFWRLWTQCDGFPQAFIEVSAPAHGMVIVKSRELADILTYLRKPMAKMQETA